MNSNSTKKQCDDCGKGKKRKIVQMRGIWKGKGFEGLNIDKEIKVVRREMSESILKREV